MALCGLTELMKPHNPFGLSQGMLYLLSVFFGFLVAVPIGITMRNFHGECVLFAELVWDGTTIYPWSKAACNFSLYFHVGFSIVYAAVMAIMTFLTVSPHTLSNKAVFGYIQWNHSNYFLQALNPFFTFFNTLVTIIMLSSAAVLSAGFAMFCMDMEKTLEELGRPMKCYKAQAMDWNAIRIVGGDTHGVDGGTFHIALSIAVVAAWCLTAVWLIQTLLNYSQFCRGCSCAIAEEKKKLSKSMVIAARRSRMTTPIGTPGTMTPTRGYAPAHAAPPPKHSYHKVPSKQQYPQKM